MLSHINNQDKIITPICIKSECICNKNSYKEESYMKYITDICTLVASTEYGEKQKLKLITIKERDMSESLEKEDTSSGINSLYHKLERKKLVHFKYEKDTYYGKTEKKNQHG